MRKLGIYVHIPFCVKKCLYCDFLSFSHESAAELAGVDAEERYVEALIKEIEKEAENYKNHVVDTVFIGGGTPSILPEQWIEKILCKLKEEFNFRENQEITPEITIEVNPGTVTEEKLRSYKEAGINRISIGTQSIREEELRILGRIHSADDFFLTYELARKVGFSNINVDVMSALPGQTCEKYRETLEKVVQLKPEHISAYSLIIEEGTPFYDRYGKGIEGEDKLPEEEEERLMYEETEHFLHKYGYQRYEISNYSLPGRECRHNIAYWERLDYVGFGLGASSMAANIRWKNEEELKQYIELANHKNGQMKRELQQLSVSEQMEEFMFLGLRLTKGVSRKTFSDMFHQEIDVVYAEILEKLEHQKLIAIGERVSLTPYGRDVSNYVMAQFLF